MALPKIDSPVFDLELPLSKKKIQFRPFLVKEQRNLLMAMESDDSASIEQNIKQVLVNCTVSGDIDINKLPVLDVEYYFLNLRARSVGEIVENKYRCDNESQEGVKCGNIMDVQLNILDIKVENVKDNQDVIELNDKITIKLRYPEFSVISRLSALTNMNEVAFEMIADSIEYIYDGEQFYYTKEIEHKEVVEFVESLNQQQFAKIEDFFANLPTLSKKVEMKCSRCGFNHTMNIEGLESFFG